MNLEKIMDNAFLLTALTFTTLGFYYLNKATTLEPPKPTEISLTYNQQKIAYEENTLRCFIAINATLLTWMAYPSKPDNNL